MAITGELQTTLLGEDRSRTARAVGVALASFVGVLALAAVVEDQRWLPEAFGTVHPLAVVVSLAVLLAGGVAAAVNAYRNDGLLVGWLLVLGPTAAWFFQYHRDPGRLVSTLAVVAVLSVVTVPVVGSVGYAAGRLARSRLGRRPGSESSEQLLRLLVGTDPARVGRWLLLAGGLTVASVLVVATTQPSPPVELFFPIGVVNGSPALGTAVTLAWVALAALPARLDDGLLASWALVFGPIFGAVVTDARTDVFGGPPLLVEGATVAVPVVVLAGVVAAVGYLLGSASRRVFGPPSSSAAS